MYAGSLLGGRCWSKIQEPPKLLNVLSQLRIRVVLIGIDYTESNLRSLSSTKDVTAMQELLLDLGVPIDHITILTGQNATRSRIVETLEAIKTNEALSEGDSFLIYFAGHCILYPASSMPEWSSQTNDRFIPAICPVDRDDSPSGKIPDISFRELQQYLSELDAKKLRVTVILDCCHSGGFDPMHFGDLNNSQSPLQSFRITDADPQGSLAAMLAAGGRNGCLLREDWEPPSFNCTLLAACRYGEPARDNGEGGDFTQTLVAKLRKSTSAWPSATYQIVWDQVWPEVHYQNPVLAGERRNNLFFQ
ncbi:hypothetical protein HGRIS_003575 [Hohenbuehelia grisea]